MRFFSNIFSFNGETGTFAALIAWLIALIAQVGIGVFAQVAPMQQRWFFPILALSSIVLFTTSARRLHQAGYSGRWAVLTLPPMLGLLAGAVITFLPQRRVRLWASTSARLLGYGALCLILIWGLLRVWWTPFWIPSESMKPALLVGDYVLARAIGAADIKAGDVVALRAPSGGDTVIKRVIAVGGDSLAVQDGVVWLNGAPLVQLPVGTFSEVMAPQGPDALRPRCENGLVGDGSLCRKSALREVLPQGRSYDILNIETGGAGDVFAKVSVPEGHIFVLGDNRDNSLDSRFDVGVGGLGMVPEGLVIGRVDTVLFSAAGSSMMAVWTWRADRLWHLVE